MAKKTLVRASASSSDPISAASRWTWFAVLLLLVFGSMGIGETGVLPVAVVGALLLAMYLPPLHRIGRLRRPFKSFTLQDLDDAGKHAPALHRIEAYNRVLRFLTSWALRLLGILFLTAAMAAPPGNSLVAFVFMLGAVFYLAGARIGAASAIKLLAEDDATPHVLYLRPFDVDNSSESLSGKVRWWRPKAFLQSREEPVLSDMFGLHGPFIAVGQPGEPVPQLGAARMYMKPDDWQDQVRSLIRDASVVLLRVGDSPGFLWEVEQVLAEKNPDQVLFCFPLGLGEQDLQSEYTKFRDSTRHLFEHSLPPTAGKNRFLRFGPGWTPELFGEMEPVLPRGDFLLPRALRMLLYHHKLQRELGRAARPYFDALGIVVVDKSVFSSLAIAFGIIFGGPATGGLMMLRNLSAVGHLRSAFVVFLAMSAIAVAIVVAADLSGWNEAMASANFLQAMRAPDAIGTASFLTAFVSYLMWKRFCGSRLQAHLRTGGKRVSNGITVVMIIVLMVIWSTISTTPYSALAVEGISLTEYWFSV